MSKISVNENPEFHSEMEALTHQTPANSDIFNHVFTQLLNNDYYLSLLAKKLEENIRFHSTDTAVHITDDERIGWNDSLQQATGYTDLKISQLINGAPETLDTLKEIADAMSENDTVVNALEAAIGRKADRAESDTHMGDRVIHVTAAERTSWNSKTKTDFTRSLSGGTKIGTISIDGVGTDLYCQTNTDTTYGNATSSSAGLMSATDKAKLDGIAAGANAYTHPATAGNKHIPSGGSSGQILRWSSDGTAAWGSDNNTTYGNATSSSAGLMSATDKANLDSHRGDGTIHVSSSERSYWNAKAAAHSHPYLPSSGGQATGMVKFDNGIGIENNMMISRNGFNLYIGTESTTHMVRFFMGTPTASDIVMDVYKNIYPTIQLYSTNGKSSHVRANTDLSGNYALYLPATGGTLTVDSSDVRLKENIRDTEVDALGIVDAIRFRQFDRKDSGKHQAIGFVVDELELLDPNLRLAGTGGYDRDDLTDEEKTNPENMNIKCVDTFYLMGYYGKAIQELHSLIRQLRGRVDGLTGVEET